MVIVTITLSAPLPDLCCLCSPVISCLFPPPTLISNKTARKLYKTDLGINIPGARVNCPRPPVFMYNWINKWKALKISKNAVYQKNVPRAVVGNLNKFYYEITEESL